MNLAHRGLSTFLFFAYLAGAACGGEADGAGVEQDALSRCHPYPERSTEPARSQRATTPPADVVAWAPPPTPSYEGPLAVNDALAGAERFGQSSVRRAEDVAFDAQGRLYTGAADGQIWRAEVAPDGRMSELEPFATVGQRPLGLDFDPCGNLIAAVPDRGIVAVRPDGEVRTLADRVDGTRIEFADELAVAKDGTVYVTDASTKYGTAWPYDFLEGRPHGRLIAYEPADGSVRVVVDGLYFPNGVVVADDESHVLFAETWRGRVSRYWLSGENAGKIEPFVENLPVVPDNISRDTQGRLWVTGQRRTPQLDQLSASAEARLALLRAATPDAAPPADPHVLVVVVDANGAIVQSLHDATGATFALSSAVPRGPFLYLATNVDSGLARVALPPP